MSIKRVTMERQWSVNNSWLCNLLNRSAVQRHQPIIKVLAALMGNNASYHFHYHVLKLGVSRAATVVVGLSMPHSNKMPWVIEESSF